MDPTTICPLCGYASVQRPCAVCAEAALRGRFAEAPVRGWRAAWEGLKAPWTGARILWSTRGTKRWLVPPAVGAIACFAWALAEALALVRIWLERVAAEGAALFDGDSWWQQLAQWLGPGTLLGALQWSGAATAVVVVLLVATFTFSVVYEVLCAPFLDLVQGRVEAAWFGTREDPRGRVVPRLAVASWRVVAAAVQCLLAAAVALWSWWTASAAQAAWPLAGLVALCLLQRPAFAALWQESRRQTGVFATGVKSSLVALALLVVFAWVQLLPFVGPPLYAAIAGCATALTLLDIPFARRGWPLSARLALLARHAGPFMLLGLSTGACFLVPVLGPLVGVPCASIGGLRLFVLLDKDAVKPN